uniref:Cation_ATPase_C domain-containing protein n=1 Tax=Macrostomum lignano TaxID=282301 RepID=A0A1I8IWC0_9PLAT
CTGDPRRRRVTEAAVLSPAAPTAWQLGGASWQAVRQHFSQLIPRLAVCGAVFARFSPVQKSQLVECLQELGYTVAMCGDGANDCGALKTAHAGISLSEAEASVASPFTSKEQNISCVIRLIRLIQGPPAALVTSFGIFKFMACYSMCQFVSVLILYWIATNLTDNQFVYIDLFIITTLFVTFSYTAACESIAQEAPSHRLLSFVTCSSIALQCGIFVAFQTLAYFYTWDAPRDNPNLSIKFVLVGAILMNFLIAFLVEQLVESVWFSRLVHRAGRRLISKPKEFERVARQLKLERGEWPPISVHFQRTGQRELLNFVAQGGGGSADEAVKPNQVSVEMKPMEADRPRADSEQQKKKKKKKYYTAL